MRIKITRIEAVEYYKIISEFSGCSGFDVDVEVNIGGYVFKTFDMYVDGRDIGIAAIEKEVKERIIEALNSKE